MEQLLKDKAYFKFITGRSRFTGKFNKESIKQSYDIKDWLKQKVSIEQIMEVIDQVEIMCHRFLINRIIFILYILCGFLAFLLFIIGIIINVDVTKSDSAVKVYNFWDLSWPYFSCFFFIPLIALGLFFVNKYYLNKYERVISEYFADININIFEKQSVIWRVGEQCSYLDLSQVSKLRSKSQEFTANSFQNNIKNKKEEAIKKSKQDTQNQNDIPYISQNDTQENDDASDLESNESNQKEYLNQNKNSLEISIL